jgi:hypothetical protein
VGNSLLLIAALYTGLLMIPATAIFSCPRGWPRWTMLAGTGLLAAAGVVSFTQVTLIEGAMLATSLGRTANQVFLFGIVGSQFLANYLSGVHVRT